MEYPITTRTWLIGGEIIFIFVLLGKSAKGTVNIRMYITAIKPSGLLMIHEVSVQYHEILEMQRREEEKDE